MDEKKKQTIEEIAKIIYKDFQAPSRYIAEQIYNAKYRKESDTAREILQYMETLKVEEDGQHQWRVEHNSCIERISCKIQQKFINGVEVK